VERLPAHGVRVLAASSVYETEPVGEVLDQPEFLNAAVSIETDHDPEALLDACKAVERALGRAAGGVRHGPRPIDVDVLLLGDTEHRSERLALPHPEVSRGGSCSSRCSSSIRTSGYRGAGPPPTRSRRSAPDRRSGSPVRP
jgi:2-amino-4-hydroxy-6-hydroxymethyldihydropteridine diphosphokinase